MAVLRARSLGGRGPRTLAALARIAGRADVNAKHGGKSALGWAHERNLCAAMRALLDARANAEAADSKGQTPLILALGGKKEEAALLALVRTAALATALAVRTAALAAPLA